MTGMRESRRLWQRWKRSLEHGNKKPEVLAKLAQYELTLKDWVRGAQGLPQVCGDCRQVLAGIPDTVRFCPVLRQQPSDRTGNSGVLRGGYLRRALSEFIGTVVSEDAVTLLDINNYGAGRYV